MLLLLLDYWKRREAKNTESRKLYSTYSLLFLKVFVARHGFYTAAEDNGNLCSWSIRYDILESVVWIIKRSAANWQWNAQEWQNNQIILQIPWSPFTSAKYTVKLTLSFIIFRKFPNFFQIAKKLLLDYGRCWLLGKMASWPKILARNSRSNICTRIPLQWRILNFVSSTRNLEKYGIQPLGTAVPLIMLPLQWTHRISKKKRGK